MCYNYLKLDGIYDIKSLVRARYSRAPSSHGTPHTAPYTPFISLSAYSVRTFRALSSLGRCCFLFAFTAASSPSSPSSPGRSLFQIKLNTPKSLHHFNADWGFMDGSDSKCHLGYTTIVGLCSPHLLTSFIVSLWNDQETLLLEAGAPWHRFTTCPKGISFATLGKYLNLSKAQIFTCWTSTIFQDWCEMKFLTREPDIQ